MSLLRVAVVCFTKMMACSKGELHGGLTMTMSVPKRYSVLCPILPSHKPPLSSCQDALDLLPYGNEFLRFGLGSNPGVQVALPRTYVARKRSSSRGSSLYGLSYMTASGRCAIEVNYSGPGSVGSWNDINNAVAAVMNQVHPIFIGSLYYGQKVGFKGVWPQNTGNVNISDYP